MTKELTLSPVTAIMSLSKKIPNMHYYGLQALMLSMHILKEFYGVKSTLGRT